MGKTTCVMCKVRLNCSGVGANVAKRFSVEGMLNVFVTKSTYPKNKDFSHTPLSVVAIIIFRDTK